jgi:hypothetical protein
MGVSQDEVDTYDPRSPRMKVVLTLGTVLTVANIYWIVLAEAVLRTIHMTVQSIAFSAVFCLFILILANFILHRFLPNIALTKAELTD